MTEVSELMHHKGTVTLMTERLTLCKAARNNLGIHDLAVRAILREDYEAEKGS